MLHFHGYVGIRRHITVCLYFLKHVSYNHITLCDRIFRIFICFFFNVYILDRSIFFGYLFVFFQRIYFGYFPFFFLNIFLFFVTYIFWICPFFLFLFICFFSTYIFWIHLIFCQLPHICGVPNASRSCF